MKDVAGKVAFITGGASGLGLAMARSFTAAGMKVVIADIQDDALDAAREEFSESNTEVLTMKVDVTDRGAMEQAAKDTIEAFGKIHVLCNNAGVVLSGNIADMVYKDWDWVMKVNLDGVINEQSTPAMRETRRHAFSRRVGVSRKRPDRPLAPPPSARPHRQRLGRESRQPARRRLRHNGQRRRRRNARHPLCPG